MSHPSFVSSSGFALALLMLGATACGDGAESESEGESGGSAGSGGTAGSGDTPASGGDGGTGNSGTSDGGTGDGGAGNGGTSDGGTGGGLTVCDNGAENPPDCDVCADGVEFFADSCADVEVPTWVPPSGQWCARSGHGLGSVADANERLEPYDSWLVPNNPEAAGHRKVFARLFSQATVQNSVKWGPWVIWNGQESAHLFLDQVRPLGVLSKGHVLVWDQQLPPLGTAAPHDVSDYLQGAGFSVVDGYPTNCDQGGTLKVPSTPEEQAAAEQAKVLLHDQIQRVINEYGEGLPIWDAVNEIIHNKCWASVFAEPGDTGWDAEVRTIVTAIDWALEVQPNLVTLLNDYGLSGYLGVEDGTYNRASMTGLVTAVLSEKKTLNGIGYQGHLLCGAAATDGSSDDCQLDTAALTAGIDQHVALGLPVYVTELDLAHARDWSTGGGTLGTIDADTQARIYGDYLRTTLLNPGVLGVTLWGYKQDVMFGAWGYERSAGESDASYWAEGPGLYDDHFAAKPAYHAVVEVLEDYYDEPGCDFIPASRFAKVGGGVTTVENNGFHPTSGSVTLGETGAFALYFFNTPYPGKYVVDLDIEHDQPSPITFRITVDGQHPEDITLDSDTPDGTRETLVFYEQPLELERGARVVRVELAEETYSCGDTWADACDGNGILHGIRLRRVAD